jgi:hypothetical protein
VITNTDGHPTPADLARITAAARSVFGDAAVVTWAEYIPLPDYWVRVGNKGMFVSGDSVRDLSEEQLTQELQRRATAAETSASLKVGDYVELVELDIAATQADPGAIACELIASEFAERGRIRGYIREDPEPSPGGGLSLILDWPRHSAVIIVHGKFRLVAESES